MSLEEKIQIANLFDQIGIDIVEAGFPAASRGDFEAVSEISKILKKSILLLQSLGENVKPLVTKSEKF